MENRAQVENKHISVTWPTDGIPMGKRIQRELRDCCCIGLQASKVSQRFHECKNHAASLLAQLKPFIFFIEEEWYQHILLLDVLSIWKISCTDGWTPTLSRRVDVSLRKKQMNPTDDILKKERVKLSDKLQRPSEGVTIERLIKPIQQLAYYKIHKST